MSTSFSNPESCFRSIAETSSGLTSAITHVPCGCSEADTEPGGSRRAFGEFFPQEVELVTHAGVPDGVLVLDGEAAPERGVDDVADRRLLPGGAFDAPGEVALLLAGEFHGRA